MQVLPSFCPRYTVVGSDSNTAYGPFSLLGQEYLVQPMPSLTCPEFSNDNIVSATAYVLLWLGIGCTESSATTWVLHVNSMHELMYLCEQSPPFAAMSVSIQILSVHFSQCQRRSRVYIAHLSTYNRRVPMHSKFVLVQQEARTTPSLPLRMPMMRDFWTLSWEPLHRVGWPLDSQPPAKW